MTQQPQVTIVPSPFDFDVTNEKYAYTEVSENYSTWRNPRSDVTVRFSLLTADKHKPPVYKKLKQMTDTLASREEVAQCVISKFIEVVIPPNGALKLPSIYDQAIAWIDPRNGNVTAGLCPWLVKEGQESIVVSKHLQFQNYVLQQEADAALDEVIENEKLDKAQEIIDAKRAKVSKKVVK